MNSILKQIKKYTSDVEGNFEAKVKVTFRNGSSRIVSIPVAVKERISAGIIEDIPSIPKKNILVEEVYQGDIVNLEDNVQGLPEGSKLEVVEAVTSDVVGKFEAKVKVTFKNRLSRIITISVIVNERPTTSTDIEKDEKTTDSVEVKSKSEKETNQREKISGTPEKDVLEEKVNQNSKIHLEEKVQELPKKTSLPKTGDVSIIVPLLGGVLLSIGGLFEFFLKRRNERE